MTGTTERGMLKEVPGDGGLPVVGDTLRFLSGHYYNNRERYDRYGPVSWMRAFGQHTVTIAGPDAIGEVLQNRDHAFANGPGWGFYIGPFFRRGLMLLDFEEHHRHRRIMQEAFTADRLAGYLEPMNAALAEGMSMWEPGEHFRVYAALKQLTLDVATRTFMGGVLGGRADRVNGAFIDCVRAGTAIVRFPVPGLRWSRGLAARRLLERYLLAQVPGKRSGDGADLFGALCHARSEQDERFTDEDVVNHMIFLLMAAHDTTTITMTTMWYYLARYPEWQRRCREESLGLGTDAMSFSDQEHLVSLDLVMRESLRLVTPVPVLARRTVKDTELMGLFVPKDMPVAVNLHQGHHLAEYWPDPERFDPERFADHRREDKIHRYAWAPFGNGVHKCIGLHFAMMQVKAAMHRALLGFEWRVDADYRMPIDWTSLPRPKDGLPVELVRR